MQNRGFVLALLLGVVLAGCARPGEPASEGANWGPGAWATYVLEHPSDGRITYRFEVDAADVVDGFGRPTPAAIIHASSPEGLQFPADYWVPGDGPWDAWYAQDWCGTPIFASRFDPAEIHDMTYATWERLQLPPLAGTGRKRGSFSMR